MKNYVRMPGNHTLMPIVVEIIQNSGGSLSYSQVVYMVMFKFDLPQKLIKKAFKEVSFSGTYLRKIGALRNDTKKGVWSLTSDYINLSFEETKKITYEKYNKLLNRK